MKKNKYHKKWVNPNTSYLAYYFRLLFNGIAQACHKESVTHKHTGAFFKAGFFLFLLFSTTAKAQVVVNLNAVSRKADENDLNTYGGFFGPSPFPIENLKIDDVESFGYDAGGVDAERFPVGYRFSQITLDRIIATVLDKSGQHIIADDGFCESWSELFSLLSNQEFDRFSDALYHVDKKPLSYKEFGLVFFILNQASATTSLDQFIRKDLKPFFKESSNLLKVQLRDGTFLEAVSPEALSLALSRKLMRYQKTIFMGEQRGFLAYINRLPAGLYKIAVSLGSGKGHVFACEILSSKKLIFFDPSVGTLSYEEIISTYANAESFEVVAMTKEGAARPFTLTGEPTLTHWLSAVVSKNKEALKELATRNKKYMQYQPGSKNKTPLMLAINNGDTGIVRFLHKELGARLEGVDKDWGTLANIAITNHHYSVLEYLLKNGGADVNQCDEHKQSLLLFATIEQDKKLVHLLLQYGANPNLASINSATPLIAAALVKPNVEICNLLLQYGANASVTWKGEPLMKRVRVPEINTALQQALSQQGGKNRP